MAVIMLHASPAGRALALHKAASVVTMAGVISASRKQDVLLIAAMLATMAVITAVIEIRRHRLHLDLASSSRATTSQAAIARAATKGNVVRVGNAVFPGDVEGLRSSMCRRRCRHICRRTAPTHMQHQVPNSLAEALECNGTIWHNHREVATNDLDADMARDAQDRSHGSLAHWLTGSLALCHGAGWIVQPPLACTSAQVLKPQAAKQAVH